MAGSKKENDKPMCFIIMPISNQSGYEDGHFSFVYDDIIKPAVEKAGMVTYRADESKHTNLIQLDILKKVINSDIAICDMSAKNPNVFYELGMRQAFDMPTVLMKDNITTAPFDISGLRYVNYNKDMKYRDVLMAVDALSEALVTTYEKRDDRSEINSLIRLMELSSPAELKSIDISDSEREKMLNEIKFDSIMSKLDSLQLEQRRLGNAVLNNNDITSKDKNNAVQRALIRKFGLSDDLLDNLSMENNDILKDKLNCINVTSKKPRA